MSTQGGTGVYMHEPCDCDDPDAERDEWKRCPCSACHETRSLETQRQRDPEGMASL